MGDPNSNSTITTNTTNPTTTSTSRVGPGVTTGSQACAACRYRRRKCAPDCPLAPYFPAHQQKQFLNAHKLFGVSNIMTLLKAVQPSEQEIAMKAMISHANVRANDPVGGYYRIICELQRQIDHNKAELELVLQQLAICRAQAQDASLQHGMQNPSVVATTIGSGDSSFDIEPLSVYDPLHLQAMDYCRRSAQHLYINQDWCNTLGFDAVKVDVGDASSSMVANGKQIFVDETEDIKPFLGIFDEKLPVPLESKESIEPRDKIVLKEDVESVQQEQEDDDLKGAASRFSLTNSND